jgi:hypothetical protein
VLKLTLALAVFFGCHSFLGASTVIHQATFNGFDRVGGLDLALGNFVRIGTFSLSDSAITANSTSASGFANLTSNFVEFGNARIGEGASNTPGLYSASSVLTGSASAALAGQQIYLWVYSSSNTSTLGTAISTIQEHGIYYMPFASNANWRFPLDPDAGSTDISTRNLTSAGDANVLRAEARILAGAFGPGSNAVTSLRSFTLVQVPEPSAFLALAVGAGLVGMRRRR